MVINGNILPKKELLTAKFEGDRIRLPPHFVEQAGLSGNGPIDCWLLVVTPGRYRLLMQPSAAGKGDLSRILRQIEDAGTPGDVLDGTESNPEAAIRARLIP